MGSRLVDRMGPDLVDRMGPSLVEQTGSDLVHPKELRSFHYWGLKKASANRSESTWERRWNTSLVQSWARSTPTVLERVESMESTKDQS